MVYLAYIYSFLDSTQIVIIVSVRTNVQCVHRNNKRKLKMECEKQLCNTTVVLHPYICTTCMGSTTRIHLIIYLRTVNRLTNSHIIYLFQITLIECFPLGRIAGMPITRYYLSIDDIDTIIYVFECSVCGERWYRFVDEFKCYGFRKKIN